ncbi:MAG TPA: DEAD/DEAH box helicase [Nitrososphaera sp.]|nr:DEAD/DEAH box helicase [Nitrososphaera sp.]
MASILAYSSRVRNKHIVPPFAIGAPDKLYVDERLESNTKQPRAKEKLSTCERLTHVFIGGRSHLTKKELHSFLAPLMLKAHEVFGKRPRDFQEHGVNSLLHKRDLIVKAAPGSGKSLIFLIMCLLRPEAIVLVIMPLLAIMNDQVMVRSYHFNGRFRS